MGIALRPHYWFRTSAKSKTASHLASIRHWLLVHTELEALLIGAWLTCLAWASIPVHWMIVGYILTFFALVDPLDTKTAWLSQVYVANIMLVGLICTLISDIWLTVWADICSVLVIFAQLRFDNEGFSKILQVIFFASLAPRHNWSPISDLNLGMFLRLVASQIMATSICIFAHFLMQNVARNFDSLLLCLYRFKFPEAPLLMITDYDDTTVRLKWTLKQSATKSHHNVEIPKYRIEVNGIFVGNTEGLCAAVTSLSPGQNYRIRIFSLTSSSWTPSLPVYFQTLTHPEKVQRKHNLYIEELGKLSSFLWHV
jgi:hypothetical protein